MFTDVLLNTKILHLAILIKYMHSWINEFHSIFFQYNSSPSILIWGCSEAHASSQWVTQYFEHFWVYNKFCKNYLCSPSNQGMCIHHKIYDFGKTSLSPITPKMLTECVRCIGSNDILLIIKKKEFFLAAGFYDSLPEISQRYHKIS